MVWRFQWRARAHTHTHARTLFPRACRFSTCVCTFRKIDGRARARVDFHDRTQPGNRRIAPSFSPAAPRMNTLCRCTCHHASLVNLASPKRAGTGSRMEPVIVGWQRFNVGKYADPGGRKAQADTDVHDVDDVGTPSSPPSLRLCLCLIAVRFLSIARAISCASTIPHHHRHRWQPATLPPPIFFLGKGPRNSNLSGRLLLSPFPDGPDARARARAWDGRGRGRGKEEALQQPDPRWGCFSLAILLPLDISFGKPALTPGRPTRGWGFVARAKFHPAARYNGSGHRYRSVANKTATRQRLAKLLWNFRALPVTHLRNAQRVQRHVR